MRGEKLHTLAQDGALWHQRVGAEVLWAAAKYHCGPKALISHCDWEKTRGRTSFDASGVGAFLVDQVPCTHLGYTSGNVPAVLHMWNRQN